MNDTLKNNSMYFPEIPGLGGPFKDTPEYEGIFSNESEDHNNLRTNSMKGRFTKLPKIGQRFSIVGESLTPGGSLRYINTSIVMGVESELPGQTIVFFTENSKYRLDYSEIEEE